MALALCLTLLPTAALAADEHTNHLICGTTCSHAGEKHTVNAFDNATKLWINGNTLMKGEKEWEVSDVKLWNTGEGTKKAYVLDKGAYYLDSDFNFNGNTSITASECAIAITGDVTLCLNSHSITCTDKWSAISVYAVECGSLTLTNCKSTGTITGGSVAAVDVRYGKTFNMYGGTLVGSSKGYGVNVVAGDRKTTMFNMYSGTITGDGDGVRLDNTGTEEKFTMSGGTISNNRGCGVLVQGGTFEMSGGEISGNKTKSNGGGVTISNGGKFEMSGTAKITQNTAGYSGGGVYVNGGTFTMSGGEISGNTAGFNGGGVHVTKTPSSSNSAFTMSNEAKIVGNTAVNRGGGVFVENGTFTVSGKPTVSENTSGSEGNKVTDNVYLCANKTITIGESGLVKGETEGALIGVTTGVDPTDGKPVAITSSATADLHSYFKADDESKYQIGCNSETKQVQLEAKPKIPLTKENTTIEITSESGFVYSGRTITPTVTVTCGSKTLKEGTDYTVSGDTGGTSARDYELIVTGKGNYTGSVEQEWTIQQHAIGVPTALPVITKTYDGTADLPTGGFTQDSVEFPSTAGIASTSKMTLKQGKDFTISGSYVGDNVNVGDSYSTDVTITLPKNGNYIFKFTNGLTGYTAKVYPTGKITKAPAPGTGEVSHNLNVVNNKKYTYTLNLNDLLPKLPDGCDYGTKKYTLVRGGLDLTGSPYYDGGTGISNDGTLTLPIKAADSVKVGGQISTGQVTAKTQNYEDITLTINVIASDAEKTDPTYTPPTGKTLPYNGQEQALINAGTVTGGTMMYRLGTTGEYSMAIPKAKDVGEYTVYFKVVGDETHNNIEDESTMKVTAKINAQELVPVASITLNKTSASLKVGGSVTLTATVSPTDATSKSVTWTSSKPEVATVANDGTVTAHKAGTAEITATAEDDSKVSATCKVTVTDDTTTGGGTTPSQPGGSTGGNTGGSSSSSSGSYDSNPIIKTETKNNPDGSTTKTETRKDGSVTQTTTAKDGSTSKTETKKDGSSVTENKAADGSTGTVKTDKNGQTTAETTLSSKAIEDAKKSGEAVKAPVEVKAARNSGAAPTVKVELPQNAGKTEVEIPVSNVKPGTVAVLVHPDGTEEILKASVPTEDGIRLTVDGSATVKIIDNSKDFVDIRNHWAKDEIDFVSARELVNGISATRYAPDATATRAQLWTILARQNDADLNGGNTWYEKAQLWSKDKGISDGTEPNAAINRAQMVTMLWRTMGQPAATDKVSFADVPAGSYYAQAVAWAVESGITQGVGGDRFDPNGACTRAQIAAFLARYMK